MFERSSKSALALSGVLSAGVLALTLACGGIDLGSTNLFSVEDEWKLGAELRPQVEKDLKLIQDEEALRLLNQMGMELVRESRFASKPWVFHLVQDDAINAFNIPGGHVYVNDGLIAAAGDASEFMAVVAHETAHGVERHATQQMTKSYGLQVVLGLALGRDPGALKSIAAQLAAGGTLSHYSREAEREADDLGLRLMVQAGYDPNGMAGMFGRLLEARQSRPGKIAQNLASHPLTETRIAEAEKAAAAQDASRGWRTDTDAFRQLQARLRR